MKADKEYVNKLYNAIPYIQQVIINFFLYSFLQCEEFKTQADAVKEGLVETYPVPCDVVRNSDIIFSCLSGPRASKDVSE